MNLAESNTTVNGLREYVPWPKELAQHYRQSGCWNGESLLQLLRKNAELHPEGVALIDGDIHRTYKEIEQRIAGLAAGLSDQGVQPGDKVILQLPNCAEFFETLFALFTLRVIPVMALPAHRQTELMHFIQISNAKFYITVDQLGQFDYRPLAKALVANTGLENVIMVGEPREFTSLSSLYQDPREFVEPDGDDLALLQLSGGTTNLPKLIPRTHNDYGYSIRQSIEICGWNRSTRYLAVLPVSHNFTLSSPGCLGVLGSGGTLVLASTGAPDVAFELIEKHRVNWTAVVPPLVSTWLQAAQSRKAKIASLDVLQVGGATFSPVVAKQVSSGLGCQLQQVFGMAEGLVNYTRLDDPDNIVERTQGKPMSAYDEVMVVDDHDQPVGRGEVGHLLTRGPYTIRGYFRAAAHNRSAFTTDGFYRTGDMVSLTESGNLVVEGRSKDQINRGGEKISVPEIEDYLIQISGVSGAVLIPVEDEFLGERGCAVFVMSEPDTEIRLSDVRRFLKEFGVADYKIPDYVVTVPHFPKTAFGKINRKVLRSDIERELMVGSRVKQSV